MLFDIGWPEFMLIGLVALVVIGPKDLPRALRTAGFWVRKARTLSREFQNSVDQMIREAELDDVHQELKKATDFDIGAELHNAVDPTGSLTESIRPPDLPDHFEPAPDAAGHAAAELPPPVQPPLPELDLPAPDAPQQAVLPLGEPEGSAAGLDSAPVAEPVRPPPP